MRVLPSLLACLLAATVTTQAQTPNVGASANPPAQQSGPLACEGNWNVVRVSEIKPGMMETFKKAVAAHQAWYAAAGAPDKIVTMRIADRDPNTKAWSYSDTMVLSSHIEPGSRTQPLPTEGDSYKAFVDLYKQSSTIKQEFRTCMPAS